MKPLCCLIHPNVNASVVKGQPVEIALIRMVHGKWEIGVYVVGMKRRLVDRLSAQK